VYGKTVQVKVLHGGDDGGVKVVWRDRRKRKIRRNSRPKGTSENNT